MLSVMKTRQDAMETWTVQPWLLRLSLIVVLLIKFLYCGLLKACPHLLPKTTTLYPETGNFVARNGNFVSESRRLWCCFGRLCCRFRQQVWTGLKWQRLSSSLLFNTWGSDGICTVKRFDCIAADRCIQTTTDCRAMLYKSCLLYTSPSPRD